jgi:hypothetical protein
MPRELRKDPERKEPFDPSASQVQSQAIGCRISDKSAEALKPVIDNSLERVKLLAHVLNKATQ